MWPINGRFDATERAIRRVRRYMREAGVDLSDLEYAHPIDADLTRIINAAI